MRKDELCQDFDEASLAKELFSAFGLEPRHKLYVAFSGGMDSTVLLHSLVAIDSIDIDRITALHANHGLHDHADLWTQQCQSLCSAWGVGFESVRLRLPAASKSGLEATARTARYRWFEKHMSADSVLITAHHLEDQAETVLANLFRGTGVHGLRGIHWRRRLGRGWIWRPLIGVRYSALLQYARKRELDWIDDPANEDLRYTRNVLRHDIIPLVKRTWPGVAHALGRTAGILSETADLLDEFARSDLERIPHAARPPFNTLSVPELGELSKPRCLNLLRYWFRCCGFEVPSREHLHRLYECKIKTQPKSTAVLSWKNVEVRRYRRWMYLSPPLTREPIKPMLWDGIAPLEVNHGHLIATPATGDGIRVDVWESAAITIRGRAGGERVLLRGAECHRKLKKLLQEKEVPPWERDRIPLLYIGDSLAAVVGFCYCMPYAATEGEPGIGVELR